MDTMEITTQSDLALLHQKIDVLTEHVEAQRRRQVELEELQQDLTPMVNQLFKLSIDELAEIDTEFQLEDLLYLVKRLLRNTRRLNMLLDRLESIMDLGDEISMIGQGAVNDAIEQLDELEKKGYFTFAQEGLMILDRIVTEYSEEDIQALGENIVTILDTVKNMTQPEILAVANNAVTAIQPAEQPQEPLSTIGLLRELRSPEVRMGMTRMLAVVKAMAEEPASVSSTDGSAGKNSNLKE
jgi:uncharacterized protein YjgD (DUF1641 family)